MLFDGQRNVQRRIIIRRKKYKWNDRFLHNWRIQINRKTKKYQKFESEKKEKINWS